MLRNIVLRTVPHYRCEQKTLPDRNRTIDSTVASSFAFQTVPIMIKTFIIYVYVYI